MRVLAIDPIVLRAISAGCPALHDTLARAIATTGLSPEIHILRDGTVEPSPRWSIAILAGEDFVEELDLDVRVAAVAAAAIPLYIGSLVDEVRREFPALLSRPEIVEGLVRLVVAGCQAAARDRPS